MKEIISFWNSETHISYHHANWNDGYDDNEYFPTNDALSPLSFVLFHLPFFNLIYCDSSFTYYRKWLVLKTYWCMNVGRRQKSVLEDIRGTSNVILFLALIYYHARCHEREAESTPALNTYYIQPFSTVPLR